MKLKFFETKWASEIELIAETPEEVAELFRMRQNTLKKPPSIVLRMHRDSTPSLTVFFEKVSANKQKNFL